MVNVINEIFNYMRENREMTETIVKNVSGYNAAKHICEAGKDAINGAVAAHQQGKLIPALAAAGVTIAMTAVARDVAFAAASEAAPDAVDTAEGLFNFLNDVL